MAAPNMLELYTSCTPTQSIHYESWRTDATHSRHSLLQRQHARHPIRQLRIRLSAGLASEWHLNFATWHTTLDIIMAVWPRADLSDAIEAMHGRAH